MEGDADVVLSDDNLEGDCGSDFGDDFGFPTEWTVLDDADDEDDVIVIDAEDEKVSTNASSAKSSSSKPAQDTKKETKKANADVKKSPAKSSDSNQDTKKPAADAKKPAADTKKPAADTKKPAADAKKPVGSKSTADVKKSEAKKQEVKKTPEKSNDKTETKTSETKKTTETKAVKSAKSSPQKNAKGHDSDLDSIEADMGEEDMETETSKAPTAKTSASPAAKSTTQERKSSSENKARDSGSKKEKQVKDEGETKPAVKEDEESKEKKPLTPEELAKEKEQEKETLLNTFSPSTSKQIVARTEKLTSHMKMIFEDINIDDMKDKTWDRMIKWLIEVYPVEPHDLVHEEVKKVMNISRYAAFFFPAKQVTRREGYLSFLFTQHRDVKLVIDKLTSIEFNSKIITIKLIKKKSISDSDVETAEFDIVSGSAVGLNLPLPGRDTKPDGARKDRLLNLCIPTGTSQQMVNAIFPYATDVSFPTLKAGEKKGNAQIELYHKTDAVRKIYSKVKIGEETVNLPAISAASKGGKDNKKGGESSSSRISKDRESQRSSGSRDASRSGGRDRQSDRREDRRQSSNAGQKQNADRQQQPQVTAQARDIDRTGRKPDIKSLRQEQAKKIRERSRQVLLNQNRTEQIRRNLQEQAAKLQQKHQQEQALKQIQMEQQRSLLVRQQIAARQQQIAMVQAQMQAQQQQQAQGNGLLGPAPPVVPKKSPQMVQTPSRMQRQGSNSMAQQEVERTNMNVMSRNGQRVQQNEGMYEEDSLYNRMDSRMMRNEAMMTRQQESRFSRPESTEMRETPRMESERGNWSKLSPRVAPAVSRRPVLNVNQDAFFEEDYQDEYGSEELVQQQAAPERSRNLYHDHDDPYMAERTLQEAARSKPTNYADFQADYPERSDVYSAGMKRQNQMGDKSAILQKRQRMEQAHMQSYQENIDDHQLQDMDWNQPDNGRADMQGGRLARNRTSWGSGAARQMQEDDTGFKVHDYGHQSVDKDTWDDNASYRQPSGESMFGGLLNTQQLGGPQQLLQQQKQMQMQLQQSLQQNQQQQQRQRGQRGGAKARKQQMRRAQEQPAQQQNLQQNRQQQQARQQQQQQQQQQKARQQQQTMIQQQMMQAAGRFQPKMVLLPTRLGQR